LPPAEPPRPPRKPRAKPRTTRKISPAANPPTEPAQFDPGAEWPDYSAPTSSWDPWDDGDGPSDPGAAVNRTLGDWLEAVVPPEAQLHFYKAGRELAAGIQATLEYHRQGGGDDDEGAQAFRIEIE